MLGEGEDIEVSLGVKRYVLWRGVLIKRISCFVADFDLSGSSRPILLRRFHQESLGQQ